MRPDYVLKLINCTPIQLSEEHDHRVNHQRTLLVQREAVTQKIFEETLLKEAYRSMVLLERDTVISDRRI